MLLLLIMMIPANLVVVIYVFTLYVMWTLNFIWPKNYKITFILLVHPCHNHHHHCMFIIHTLWWQNQSPVISAFIIQISYLCLYVCDFWPFWSLARRLADYFGNEDDDDVKKIFSFCFPTKKKIKKNGLGQTTEYKQQVPYVVSH